MERFQNLGRKLDLKQRISLARIDNNCRKQKITSARDIIYEKRYAVNSESVDNILKDESWAPNAVGFKR
jgi:hypothetical protein